MCARCADGGVTDSLLASPAFFGALADFFEGVLAILNRCGAVRACVEARLS